MSPDTQTHLRGLYLLLLLTFAVSMITLINVTGDVNDLEDRPNVHAKVFEDGSAQILIGRVVCGLPPSSNNVAYARCHLRGEAPWE